MGGGHRRRRRAAAGIEQTLVSKGWSKTEEGQADALVVLHGATDTKRIFDAKTKQLLWRGTAQDELKEDPKKREKQLAKGSEKLFKDFPPGSAKK